MTRTPLRDPISLPVQWAMLTTLELPFEVAARAVPDSFEIVEVRPDRALVSLAFFRLGRAEHPGRGVLEPYAELALAFHVAPSLGQGVPRMALWVHRMGTTLPAANDHLRQVHWVPVHDEPLQIDIDDSGARVEVRDRRGPIASCGYLGPKREFLPKASLVQIFVMGEDGPAMYQESMEGEHHEHQVSRHVDVKLHDHPFLGALASCSPLTPYMQLSSRPSTEALQRAERPRYLATTTSSKCP